MVLNCVPPLATPWTVAHSAPLSMGFSRQEYWNGLPFPSPGDFPNPGIKPIDPNPGIKPALAGGFFTTEPPGKPSFRLLAYNAATRKAAFCFTSSCFSLLLCIYCICTSIYKMGFPGGLAGKESTCKAGEPSLIPGWGSSPGEEIGHPLQYSWASLVAQKVKNPPAMWETWVRCLGWED